MAKFCPTCGETKEKAEFYKARARSDGRQSQCKVCVCARRKAYYANNKEKVIERGKKYRARPEVREKRAAYNRDYQKRYYAEHREAVLARQQVYMSDEDNRKKKEASQKAWVEKNRARVNANSANCRERNPERWQGVLDKYRENNRERVNAEYNRRMRHDPEFGIPIRLRSRLRAAIKRGYRAGSAVRDLGCSIAEFKEYIASQFQSDMTWENWGEWHLDHIKPLSSFDLTDREQFLEACHFSNMQPLWAAENLRKGCRHQ